MHSKTKNVHPSFSDHDFHAMLHEIQGRKVCVCVCVCVCVLSSMHVCESESAELLCRLSKCTCV